MAINLDVKNLDDYPDVTKRITLDIDSLVPVGTEADEKFVLKASTSAYSNNVSKTAIADTYVTEFNVGWVKSTGMTGNSGKFLLDATHNTIKIKMDATVSGTDGNGYYQITLDYTSDGRSKSGEDIAADMELKIRDIDCVTADTGYQLAYTNSSVEFKNGKFWITSGTLGRYYTGSYRSSVDVVPGATNDCSIILGFNMPVSSEDLSGIAISESLIVQNYIADSTPLYIGVGTGVTADDCLIITDGTNTDYFPVLAVSGTILTVPTMASNSFTGISHNYTVTNGAKVQILRIQDPDNKPNSWCTSIDDIMRYGMKGIVNQIDFSS